MAESLHQYFVIKATSKITGHVHYVEINDDECIGLVDMKCNASLFSTKEQAEKAMEKYCEDEQTHSYMIDSIIMSLEELITEH